MWNRFRSQFVYKIIMKIIIITIYKSKKACYNSVNK